MKDIRTKQGKLVGRLDERAGVFTIKDGGKATFIEIPPCGLRIRFTVGNGATEEICIPPSKQISAA